MLELWNESLGEWALPVWMAIGVLAVIWLAIPPALIRASRGGSIGVGGWASAAALLPLAILPVLLLVPFETAPLAITGGLTLPLFVLIAYLVARATAPACDECGREMRRRWRFCPFHEVAAQGVAFGGLGIAAAGMPLPAPMPAPVAFPFAPAMPWTPGAAPFPAVGGFGAVGISAPSGPAVGSISVSAGPNRGLTFTITVGGATIGRDPGSEISLDDPAVSGRHARIVVSDGRAQVVDLGSSNGTAVQGRPVDRAFLFDGDRIEVGDTVLVYQELR